MRQTVNINFKWAFSKECTACPETMPEKWYWVNLPHTWNAIDGQDGGSDYYRGTAWYAKSIEKVDLPEAERYYLEILGANASADVYVNGSKLAHHDGGYSTFRVDITDSLAAENLIAIAVDNSVNDTVYPQTADFTFYGGLYRDVNIICVNESHFELEYFGTPGLKVTPVCSDGAWTVNVEGYVANQKPGQQLKCTIKKPCGCTVAEVTNPVETRCFYIPLEKAHLWNGRKDPYLYTAVLQLIDRETVIDEVSARFGCRTFDIDPDKGFILNGESYPLRGVSRHQDRWGVGNALTPEMHAEDIDLILEGGFTTIRLAHYQHAQYFYDLCDEKGLVIWAEIPYISRHMPNGRANTISQMKELITQNYNHPSIVVWGLSNEITMNGADDPDLISNHEELEALVKKLDPSRKTTMAIVSQCPVDAEYIKIPDCVSWNHYFGWYGGDTSMNGPWMDKFHAANPTIPVGMSEYGCEALNWHTSNPESGDYSEEYQAFYHEELIKALYTRPYIWATHVWNMFDFGCDGRNEGGENGQNHKGLVTFDRKYKKDSFYAYKAWLSDEPFVHICGKRYVDRPEAVTKVTVYSNLPEVELFANGKSLGKQACPEHFFYFNVPISGTVKLKAVAGDQTDTSEIVKVDEPNPAYRMVEKGAVLNWFDITEIDGMLSLNSKAKDIIASSKGKELLQEFFEGFGQSKMLSMLDAIGSWTLLRLCSMLAVVGIKPTKEMLLSLNEKLNQCPKE